MMERLTPFIGEWDIEVSLPSPPDTRARAVFEWALDGRFLVERAEITVPEAPNSMCLMGVDPNGLAFTQHYFDSRGVIRIYAMTFEDGVWTLQRDKPDFSDLNFWQRFKGTLSEDGDRIGGRWETSHDEGATWEKDFDLVYTRVK
jgi:hypothetical protein